ASSRSSVAHRTIAPMGAKRLLAAVVDSSDDAIISKRLDGIVISWNKAAERIFGYTADEMIGQPITRLFPEDRLDEEPKIIKRIAHGERVDHFETLRKTKEGRLIDVSLTISPIKDAHGKIIGASKIARDITERKLMAEELRHGAEELRLRADSISKWAWMAEGRGDVLWYNRRWYEYTGTTFDQVGGWGWQSLHDPRYLPLVVEKWRDSI